MMTPTEMIDVLKAYEEGKEIEIYDGRAWIKCNPPLWNFALCKYRVKQNEKAVYQFLLQDKQLTPHLITSRFFPDIETAQKEYMSYNVIKRLDYTKTIIEE